jgi:alginate O-acetyltransferase complex protein AlgI
MLFSSLTFLYLFLPLTLLFFYIVKDKLRNLLLLIASLIFYAWGGPSLVSVLAGSIVINYFSGILIGRSTEKKARKAWFVTGLILNLGLLVSFKYTPFVVENFNVLTQLFGVTPILLKKIILPLGISFFTFKAITYLVSVYRHETEAERKFVDLGLYISLFPQLIAGPISRYRDLAPQLKPGGRVMNTELFASGINRFVLGLAKKILIANPFAYVADQAFSTPANQLYSPLAWFGIICFTLQIYYDFSGYSDIAIGLGRMFGFSFVENFNFPYISKSLREFWKRWHISLSTWFRDYVFLPVAYSASRKLPGDRYFGIRTDKLIYLVGTSVTFFLCGLWHGSTWNFIVWGMLHGVVLIAEQAGFGKLLKKFPKAFQHLYLIVFILLSMVFFRADTLRDAINYIGIMFGAGTAPANWNHLGNFLNIELIFTGIIGLLGCTTIFSTIAGIRFAGNRSKYKIINHLTFYGGNAGNLILILVLLFLVTVQMTAGTINPFIYFRF